MTKEIDAKNFVTMEQARYAVAQAQEATARHMIDAAPSFSHLTGDEALVAFASILRDTAGAFAGAAS